MRVTSVIDVTWAFDIPGGRAARPDPERDFGIVHHRTASHRVSRPALLRSRKQPVSISPAWPQVLDVFITGQGCSLVVGVSIVVWLRRLSCAVADLADSG